MAVRRAAVPWGAHPLLPVRFLGMPPLAFAAPTPRDNQYSPLTPAHGPPAAAVETAIALTSRSAGAVQLTPAPVSGAGPGPLLFGAAALALVALGAIAFYLVRRS